LKENEHTVIEDTTKVRDKQYLVIPSSLKFAVQACWSVWELEYFSFKEFIGKEIEACNLQQYLEQVKNISRHLLTDEREMSCYLDDVDEWPKVG